MHIFYHFTFHFYLSKAVDRQPKAQGLLFKIFSLLTLFTFLNIIIIIIVITIRVSHPNADSYKTLTPEQIYKLHENDKKRLYSSRVLEVEQGTFTPLVFTTTGGISNECQRYHSRLAELLAVKKQESYASTIAWILRSALTCLRGSRSRRRTIPNIQETDLELEVSTAFR